MCLPLLVSLINLPRTEFAMCVWHSGYAIRILTNQHVRGEQLDFYGGGGGYLWMKFFFFREVAAEIFFFREVAAEHFFFSRNCGWKNFFSKKAYFFVILAYILGYITKFCFGCVAENSFFFTSTWLKFFFFYKSVGENIFFLQKCGWKNFFFDFLHPPPHKNLMVHP